MTKRMKVRRITLLLLTIAALCTLNAYAASESTFSQLSLRGATASFSKGWKYVKDLSCTQKVCLGLGGVAAVGVVAYARDSYIGYKDLQEPDEAFQRALNKKNWLSQRRIKHVINKVKGDVILAAIENPDTDTRLVDFLKKLKPDLISTQSASMSATGASDVQISQDRQRLVEMLGQHAERIKALTPNEQPEGEISQLFDHVDGLALGEFNDLYQENIPLRETFACCAVLNNNVAQVRKCLLLAKESAELPVAGSLPLLTQSSSKGKNKVQSNGVNLLEWYVRNESDLSYFSQVLRPVYKPTLHRLHAKLGQEKAFDILHKLKQIGMFDPERSKAFEKVPLDGEHIRAYITLLIEDRVPAIDNELVINHIQSRIPSESIKAHTVRSITIDTLQNYYEARSSVQLYNARIKDMTSHVEAQDGDTCALHAFRNAVRIKEALDANRDASEADIAACLRVEAMPQKYTIGGLKACMRDEAGNVKQEFADHCTEHCEDLDSDAIDALARLYSQDKACTAIDSVSLFSPDHTWQKKARTAIADIANNMNVTHIIMIKEDNNVINIDGQQHGAQSHWTSLVVHKVDGGKPIVYLTDSDNPNKGSSTIDMATILAALSDGEEYDFGLLNSSSTAASSVPVEAEGPRTAVKREHSDILSVIRVLYLLNCSKAERETGAAIYELFDSAQTRFRQGRDRGCFESCQAIVETVQRNKCMESPYFYFEYICDKGESLGLRSMLQQMHDAATDKMFCEDIERLLVELSFAEVNMRNDVDDRRLSSSSQAASSAPVD